MCGASARRWCCNRGAGARYDATSSNAVASIAGWLWILSALQIPLFAEKDEPALNGVGCLGLGGGTVLA